MIYYPGGLTNFDAGSGFNMPFRQLMFARMFSIIVNMSMRAALIYYRQSAVLKCKCRVME